MFGRILVDDKEAQDSLSKTDKKSKSVAERMGSGLKTAAKWGIGIATAAAGAATAAGGLAVKAAGAGDRIDKMSQQLGMSRSGFQEWDFVLSQSGSSIESMKQGMKTLSQRMQESAEGTGKGADNFEKLGLSVLDANGNMKDQEQIFEESIVAFQGMEDGVEKAALAQEMFGRSGQELLPLLNGSRGSLDELQEAYQELGIEMSDEAVDAGVKFTDTMDQLKRSLGFVFNTIGVQLMPIFQTMADWVIGNMPLIQQIFGFVFDAIGQGVSFVIDWLRKIIDNLSQFYQSNQDTFMGIWQTIQEVFTNVVNFLSEAWQFITDLWQTHGSNLVNLYKAYFTAIWETIQVYMTYAKEIISTILNFIVPWVREKLAELQRFWQENGQQITQAVQNAFKIIQGIISFVMPVIQGMISGAWKIIQSVFDATIGIILGLVKVFSSLLTGDFNGIKEGLTRIWNALWDGIKGIVSGAWSMLSGAFSALKTNVSGWFTGLKDDALGWGKGMIDGFVQGIKDKANAVKDAVTGVMDNVKGFLGFNSPAEEGEGRHIVEWGANMIDGFLDGVESQITNAKSSMNNVVANMKPEDAPQAKVGVQDQTQSIELSWLEELMLELIKAVREGKQFLMDGRTVARLLGPHIGDEGGERIKDEDRGLVV